MSLLKLCKHQNKRWQIETKVRVLTGLIKILKISKILIKLKKLKIKKEAELQQYKQTHPRLQGFFVRQKALGTSSNTNTQATKKCKKEKINQDETIKQPALINIRCL